MREIYLPAFEAAVKEAHVGAIMDSYNLINGEHVTQNDFLNNDIAKKDWGFEGIVMSDWDATYDGVAAANGGLDLEMPFGKIHESRKRCLPAVKSGKVSEATIDDKVRRILRTAITIRLARSRADGSVDLALQRTGRAGRARSRARGHGAAEERRRPLAARQNEDQIDRGHRPRRLSGSAGRRRHSAGGAVRAVSYLEGISRYLRPQVTVYYHHGVPRMAEVIDTTDYVRKAGDWGGVKAEYFANANWSGKPAVTRPEEHIELDASPLHDHQRTDERALDGNASAREVR